MPVDEPLLEAHASFESADLGISERFVRPELAGARTVAVLARPLRDARSFGWVVCHAFAGEMPVLAELDVRISRALARAGFPVLRYHGHGYGDSEGHADVSLETHLADAAAAADVMRRDGGVERIGLVGARFGATVAALVADREGLPAVALVDPVVRGDRYMRDLLRRVVVSGVAGDRGGGSARPPRRMADALEEQGWLDVHGFKLTRSTHDGISSIDLARQLRAPKEAVLLAGVSRSAELRPELRDLASTLRSLAPSYREVLLDGDPSTFGMRQWRDTGRLVKTSLQTDLAEAAAASVAAWAREALP